MRWRKSCGGIWRGLAVNGDINISEEPNATSGHIYLGGESMRLFLSNISLMLLYYPAMALAADGSKSSFFGNIISFIVSVIVTGFLINLFIKKK